MEEVDEVVVDVIEGAVGEGDDDVSWLGVGGSELCELAGIGGEVSDFAEFAEVLDELVGVEALVWRDFFGAVDFGDEDASGEVEGGGEGVLENVAAGGVGSGLEESPDAGVGELVVEGGEGFADGGGVVSEVVDEVDVVDEGDGFEAAFDAAEGGECGLDSWDGDLVVVSGDGSHSGVADVVGAG